MTLAIRAATCEAFEFLVGMPVHTIDRPDRVGLVMATANGLPKLIDWLDGECTFSPKQVVPALGHAGAVGYLLELVRRAWGEPTLTARIDARGRWVVESNAPSCELPIVGRGATELEALVDALERSPQTDKV